MISGKQARAARARLGISQIDLARISKVSVARVTAFELGGDCLLSTAEALVTALEGAGAVFSRDGGVRIIPKAERFIVDPGQNPDAETRRKALAIVNAGRKRDGLPPVVDVTEEGP